MFERYTEKARRVIFFARYEASQFGSPYIETEHLLLGVLREDKAFTHRYLHGVSRAEAIRAQIEAATTIREKIPTSVDLPLTNECKRVLAYAAEEAERLNHKHIGSEHLALGLLREEKCFAAQLLAEHGVRLSALRKDLAHATPAGSAAIPSRAPSGLAQFTLDLTQVAIAGQPPPLVGREKEIELIVDVLGRSTKNNPVLVGEPGVGKSAIVMGLAQKIVDGDAPSLANRRLVSLDLSLVVAGAKHNPKPAEFLNEIANEIAAMQGSVIFFVDALHPLLAAGVEGGALEVFSVLKTALQSGKVQCIAAATPQECQNAMPIAPWLAGCFWPVEITPVTEEDAIHILLGIKERYEKFHSVAYTEEAITYAVKYSNRHLKKSYLPGKAIDLMDDAAAHVKLHQAALPEEVREVQKRIRSIVHRMEDAVANHEFEKARFHSAEEKKERDNLSMLWKKHNLDKSTVEWVTRESIEEALARWTGMSVEAIRQEAPAADSGAQPGAAG